MDTHPAWMGRLDICIVLQTNQNFFTHLLNMHQRFAALSSRTFSARLQFCYSFHNVPRES